AAGGPHPVRERVGEAVGAGEGAQQGGLGVQEPRGAGREAPGAADLHEPARQPQVRSAPGGGDQPEPVVLAGFMKILRARVLAGFAGRVVKHHPALLPSFPGAHGVADALAYGVKVTGCT
ncbi:hypothetical protein UK12_33800, partial [Saccharothrix sp. ST-888]